MVGGSEHDLVQRAKNSDTAALEELLVKTLRKVRGTISRMLQGNDDVEDVLQKVLLKVQLSISGFEGRSQFSTWAVRIAINECLDYFKKHDPNRFLCLDGSEVPHDTEGGSRNSVEELVLSGPSPNVGSRHQADMHEELHQETVRQVYARVRKEMGPQKFESLELCYIDGHKAPKVAALQGLESQSVVYDIASEFKRRVRRALKEAHRPKKKPPPGVNSP